MPLAPTLAGLAAFAVSVALVPLCGLTARKLGYTSEPRDDRWHKRSTPLFGGLAIVLTVLAVQMTLSGPFTLPILLAGAFLIALVGFIDDLVSLKPYAKLVAEIAIASLFVFFGYRFGFGPSPTFDILLTMFWIVGMTNAFNLLDNMDGLCAGIALIAGAALLASVTITGEARPETQYLAVLLGATAGFLVYNLHPASIFMGDSGSLFIGLNLGVLTLGSPQGAEGPARVLSIVVAPLLVLLVPIVDTTLVTASRLLSGRSAAQGGRDHSSHRLVAIGLSERAAVAVLWVIAALGGGLALAIHWIQTDWLGITAAIFILATIIFAVYLAHVHVYDDTDTALIRSGRITPFVVNFMYKRRVAEVLLDVCLVSIAYYSAYRVRFEGEQFSQFYAGFITSLPLVLGVQMFALFFVGVYRGIWRYFGLMDSVAFVKGVFLGTLISVALIVYLYRFEAYSRGVFIIYSALLLLMLCGSRASFRLISEFVHRRHHGGQRLIIYGAGDVGASAVRDMLSRSLGGYKMLGFIDDDPGMARARMQGYPVLGDYKVLAALVTTGSVDIVVITRLIDVERLEELRGLCAQHHVALARLNFSLDQLVAAS